MKLVVGLGNNGDEYKTTRHNLGFMVIENFVKSFKKNFKEDEKFFYQVLNNTIFLKSKTSINNSGNFLKDFLLKFKIESKDIMIVYDDINIPFGKLRYRKKGSSGGHNGVKDIIKNLQTEEFDRLKVGIGYEKNILLNEWVLGNFSFAEKKEIELILQQSKDFILNWINKKTN